MTKSASKTTAAKSAPATKSADVKSADPAQSPAEASASAGDAPATPSKANKKNADIVRVRSKAERFRRAGIEFNRDGIDLDVGELTAEQIDAINAEPNLVIDGGEIPSDGKKAAK